ncbi:MAG: hypothetical protein RMK91_12035 [Pseudanabaenaceae cyanobacterium SKYGB_i_bin29]|nr:nitrite/sulfite reductase [Pseudanabaenaceae cyanobacterium SKYG29]MDW8422584.1 hypothetical protein [Pseudanabaenaceae cyanobacterium SKYGB_i_bin29]
MSACPSMWQPIPTKGGWLYRLRLVGGRVTLDQLRKIRTWVQEGEIEISRRGNLQYRSASLTAITVIEELQAVGLIGDQDTDHLRNIMLSPTCGIDRQAVIDLSPLAKEWEEYLSKRREWQKLSAKFSIGFDGGEALSIKSLTNDILVSAIDGNYCQIIINGNQGLTVSYGEVINLLDQLTSLYLEFTHLTGKQPRFLEMMKTQSIAGIWQQTMPVSRNHLPLPTQHIGIYPQKDKDYYYIGIFLPFGRLSAVQLEQLITVCNHYQIPEVRFTPWRNLILPFVHHSCATACCQTLSHLHFSLSPPPLQITVCAGKYCSVSFTDTQKDAQELQEALSDHSLRIHLSGCSKLCAYDSSCDWLAIGYKPDYYHLYYQNQLVGECPAGELLTNIKKFL